MKKLFKKKKVVLGFIVILFILAVGIYFILCRNNDNAKLENKILKNGTFTAYIKINPLVKLTFDASYYECTNDDGMVSICGKYTNEVTNAELLNDDANSIYKDIDFNGKDLYESILALVETAKDNGYDISNVNWTTDWNYQVDDLKNKITDKVKEDTNVEITINFNYQETIDEASILESENTKTYNVKFDSNGGTNVKTETIKENSVVSKPTDPTKDGYTFVEWQLDGNTYDFNSKVTSDITLKAKWKEKKSNTSSNTNTGANTNINSDSDKTNSTDNNNTSNNSSDSETKSEEQKCIAKKFDKKYSYVYDSMDVCKKKGNDAFNELSDTNEPDIFAYGCQEIVDDCGTKWYGVFFYKWSEDQGEYPFYY
jgi:uncharacterized repeat protein (TIGR02543 family)